MRRPGSAPPRPLSRSPLIGLLVLALAVASCSSGPFKRGIGEVVAGSDLQVLVGETWKDLAVGAGLSDGAVLRTDGDEARLDVGGTPVWLSPAASVTLTRDGLALERGEVLVHGAGGGLAATLGELEVRGPATYRLSSGPAPRLGVYRGGVDLARPGEVRGIQALREVGLAVRRLPDGVPLAYSEKDPWDRDMLAGAIAFDHEIERLRRGIDRRYGTDPQDPAFYQLFAAVDAATLPILAAGARVVLPDQRFGPPSDALLTLFVAQARGRGDLQEVARRVTSLRRAGARWGLVAEDLGISAGALSASVDLSEERRVALASSAQEDAGEPAPAVPSTPQAASSPPPAPAPAGGNTAPPRSGGRPEPGEEEEPDRGGGSDDDDGGALEPFVPPIPSPDPAPPLPPPPEEEDPGIVARTVGDVVEAARDVLEPWLSRLP